MSEQHPARPVLATIICIYQLLIVVVPRLLLLPLRPVASPRRYHAYPTHPTQSVLGWLSVALAIAAVVALWQMRRLAFVLFLSRFVLSLVLLFLRLPVLTAQYRLMSRIAPASYPSVTIMIVTYGVIAVGWILSALIVWYVYAITTPKITRPSVAQAEAGT